MKPDSKGNPVPSEESTITLRQAAKLNKPVESALIELPGGTKTEELLRTKWLNNMLDYLGEQETTAVAKMDMTKKQDLKKFLKSHSGHHEGSIALICPGEKECPISSLCWFLKRKENPPEGEVCPIELGMFGTKTIEYAAEFDIKDYNFIDFGYCKELANLDILDQRMNIALAQSGKSTLVTESFSGEFFEDTGEPIMAEHIAFEWRVKKEIADRKKEIHRAMIGTRESKLKRDAVYKFRPNDQDPAKQVASQRQEFDDIINKNVNADYD